MTTIRSLIYDHVTQAAMDDLVDSVASRRASSANNEGLKAQLALIEDASLSTKGVDPDSTEEMDDLTHDAADTMACKVNNEGLKEQIEFLNQSGMDDEAIRDYLIEEGHLPKATDPLGESTTSLAAFDEPSN